MFYQARDDVVCCPKGVQAACDKLFSWAEGMFQKIVFFPQRTRSCSTLWNRRKGGDKGGDKLFSYLKGFLRNVYFLGGDAKRSLLDNWLPSYFSNGLWFVFTVHVLMYHVEMLNRLRYLLQQ